MTPVSFDDGWLAPLGLKLANVAAGAVASFASLRFFEGISTGQKWSTFVGGWAVAAWGGPPVATYLELSPKTEVGIVLLLGLFGMAAAAETIKVIRDTNWKGIIEAVLNRKGSQ